MEPLIIEVALNELSSKDENPNIPYSLEEIARDAIECARAGAAIVHFHARDPKSGEQRWHDTDTYIEAFRLIRAECDAMLYPTQPGSGLDVIPHVLELAEHPEARLELATVDVFPPQVRFGEAKPPDPMVEQMRALRERGVVYSIGVREIGHMRYIRAYHELGLIDDLHLKIFFDDEPRGPRPDARGLLMYLDSVPEGVECRWFTTVFRGDPAGDTLRRMSMLAAAMGGHIRTGIGDNPQLDGNASYRNVDHVEMAVELAHAAGREVASAAEARRVFRGE